MNNYPKHFYDDEEDYPSQSYYGDNGFDNDFINSEILEDNSETNITSNNNQRLLLMGLRRSGKSSIFQVVFHKMGPNETLFLESTSKVTKDNITSFINFQVWDFPGQLDYFDGEFDAESIFSGVGALVFVIDAQDDYLESLTKLHDTVIHAYNVNPDIAFEVFVHKVDGLSDDYKIDLQRDIQQRVLDELADVGLENIPLAFYLTSIYDHSIFEAFSKVIQKMIRQLPTLENLLNILCSNSGIEKAYLFDITSKIYLATDSSPVDMQSYEICSDMIDVVIDLTSIYNIPPTSRITSSDEENGIQYSSVSSKEAYSSIQLNNGLVLYFRVINPFLALVCLLRQDAFEKRGLIDYNFQCFKQAILQVIEVRNLGVNVISDQDGFGLQS
ncbi:ras-related GTP binding C [Neoconidiobolus thromboides FSU 785]|nr:ras-related GTP binding C [Neoconidiobolus thromboides FSU 785]